MGSKGSQTTTQQSSTSATPQAESAYSNLLNQAQGVAATPYQAYSGQLVAPFNQEQNAGVSGINQYANAAQPAINYATNQAATSSAPLTQAQIQQYMSPYTQDVVNATQAQFNNQNAQQQEGIQGNAIAQGALGGNREAIAQAETTNQENLAQAPVIAGLENQGYQTGLSTAENQQATGLAGANAIGNLGVAGQTAGESGASNILGAGTAQQGTQQALDTALLQQYQQQQAYPFQTAQWLAGIDTGVGSAMGSSTSGETTAPAPNALGQILGGVTSGAGLLGATGAYGTTGWLTGALAGLARGGVAQIDDFLRRASGGKVGLIEGIAGYADGGGVRSYATGGASSPYTGGIQGSPMGVAGTPWAMAPTYVPTFSGAHGTPQKTSGPSPATIPNPTNQQAASLGSLANSIVKGVNGQTPGAAVPGDIGPSSVGGPNGPAPLVSPSGQQLTSAPTPSVMLDNNNSYSPSTGYSGGDPWAGIDGSARGGGVLGFEDGGAALSDMVMRGRGIMQKDRDDSSKFAARMNAGMPVPEMTHKGITNYLRQPIKDYADGGDVDVPTADQGPFRLDPEATQKWRDGVDSGGTTDNTDQPASTPAEGVLPPEIKKGKSHPDDDSTPTDTALAFSGDNGIAPPDVRAKNEAQGIAGTPPTPTKTGFDWGSSNKLWPALISAGFGAMASRSPFLANVIGEGGQAGMSQYAAEQKQEIEAQQHAEALAHQAHEEARQDQAAKQSAINQPIIFDANGKPVINPDYVKAKQQLEKDWQPKLQKIGVNIRGDDVMGVWDPNTKTAKDLAGNPVTIQNGVVQPATQPTVTPPPADNSVRPSAPPSVRAAPESAPPSVRAAPENPEPQSSIPSSPNAANTPSPYRPTAALGGQVPLALVQKQAGYQTPPPPPHDANPSATQGTDAARNTNFLNKVAEQDPAYALAIQKAADYELDPGKYSSMRRDRREHFINDVLQYDPSYNPQDVGLRYKAQTAFLPGTKSGDTVRSFNTAISHLDTLEGLYKAVNNGDWQTYNKFKNAFETEFGYSPPNTLNGIAQIVSGEVVKATVGSQNALGDREELRKTLDPKLAQGQALDVIHGFQQLMGGQLHSLKYAYEQSTGLHNFDDKFLLPRSREMLKHIDNSDTGSQSTLSPQDKQAADWAKANPNDPRAAAIKKRLNIP